MARPYALLRAGFPYVKTIGMRRVTNTSVDVAIDRDEHVYVLGRGGDIARLTLDDDDLRPIAGGGSDDGKFEWPVAMIIDRDENLTVSDEALHRITTVSKGGEFIGKWGEHGDGDGQLNRPSGIAFDPEENIYVVDTLNHRVQKFTKDGKFLLTWGTLGDADGQFNMPWGVAVDELSDVYVADWRNDRVQKFTAEGEFIFEFGTSGSGDGEFRRPLRPSGRRRRRHLRRRLRQQPGPAIERRGELRRQIYRRRDPIQVRPRVHDVQWQAPQAARDDQAGTAEAAPVASSSDHRRQGPNVRA